MRVLQLALWVAVAAAAPAIAQQTATPSPAKDDDPIVITKAKPDDNKRVCKASVATGSIMTRRICKTKREWEEQHERDMVKLEQMRMAADIQMQTEEYGALLDE